MEENGYSPDQILPVQSIVQSPPISQVYYAKPNKDGEILEAVNVPFYYPTYLINDDALLKYSYKTEDERIKLVKRLNKKIKLNNYIAPELFYEYPVNLLLIIHEPYLDIDSHALYKELKSDIVESNESNISARWNKSVLEHYRNMSLEEFSGYEIPYRRWFEVARQIPIDSKEYKDIPLLYNEQLRRKYEKTVKSQRTLKQYKAVKKKFTEISKKDTDSEYNKKDIAKTMWKNEYTFYRKRYSSWETIYDIIRKKKWNYIVK
jgi:hypothetical protein